MTNVPPKPTSKHNPFEHMGKSEGELSLVYEPDPNKILWAMKEKRKELDDAHGLTEREVFIFGYAWREAMLNALEHLYNIHVLVKYEHAKDTPPTYKLFNSYLERMATEIEKDNALSPYLNYKD